MPTMRNLGATEGLMEIFDTGDVGSSVKRFRHTRPAA